MAVNAEYALFVNGKLCITGTDPDQLWALGPTGSEVQVVRIVQPTGPEREYYSINAYVAECGTVTAVDVSMAFNISLGAAIKTLATLERYGMLQSTLTVEAFGKQVRRYTPREAV